MRFKIATVLVLILSIFSLTAMPALGVTYDDVIDAQREKERLQRELESQKSESRTLAEQIAFTENQIKLNELEIQDTQGQIQSTQNLIIETDGKINDLNRKLDVLDETLKQMQEVAEARIRDAYKQSRTPEFGVLVRSGSFTDAMKTYEYLKALEAEDARVLSLVSENQKNYGEEKDNLEQLKSEKKRLVSQLEVDKEKVALQQQELDNVRNYKDSLLAQSKNEESRYSSLLYQKELEIQTLQYILASGGVTSGQYLGYVYPGRVVGFAGDTGCSSGTHVHFSYQTNGAVGWPSAVNPMPLFGNELTWPGRPGQAPWTNNPFGGGHNGIDVPLNHGEPLRASKQGNAYLHVIPTSKLWEWARSGICPVGAYNPPVRINGAQLEVWIEHDDGSRSIYAHVSGGNKN